MSQCQTCHEEIPDNKKNQSGRGKKYWRCRACHAKIVRKYRNTPKGRAAQARASSTMYKKHKVKMLARLKARFAVKTGTLIKPKKCEVCEEVKPLQGHHEDYSKPLEVIWLCTGCHADADRERERRLTRPN